MRFGNNAIDIPYADNFLAYKKQYIPFRLKLLDKPSLYCYRDTFYFKMRYAGQRVSALFNKISNEILAYADSYDVTAHAGYRLYNNRVEFYLLDAAFARIVIEGDTLVLYLALDPERYTIKDKIYSAIDEKSELGQLGYKMVIRVAENDKAYKDNVTVKYVRDMMHDIGCHKDFEYAFCDYASFYRRETLVANKPYTADEDDERPREENTLVVTQETIEQVAINDILHIEITDEDEFEEEEKPSVEEKREEPKDAEEILREHGVSSDDFKVKQKKVAYIEAPVQPKAGSARYDSTKKSLFYKQKMMWIELQEYGYHFLMLKRILFYAAAIALAVGIGFMFKLKWWAILLTMVTSVMCMPFVITAYYRNKYEKRRFHDVESYIEQILYSFRKNGKVLMALRDALVVFPNGTMHNQIVRAMAYIRETNKEGTPYWKALGFIEEAYPCRRIRALHRYIVKVENTGGSHDVGVDALIKDRRMWIDRIDVFRKQYSATNKEVMISVAFSFAIAAFMVFMLPSDMVNLADSIVYQLLCVVFAIANIVVTSVVFCKTVLSISDGDVTDAERTKKKIAWIRHYDKKEENKKALKQSALGVVVVAIGLLMQNKIMWIFGLVMAVYLAFVQVPMKKNSANKSVCRELEKVFPDWLLELSLLLQTDNLHVAIEKTIDTAPEILKPELKQLADDIATYPSDFTPYADFLSDFPVESVHSSMRLLYSIGEFGTDDELYQLSELVDRNNKLMDQAERYRNDDKVAAVFMLKFVPSLSSSLKMMVDMIVFLLTYMGSMM